jgi:hypothetical protein
MLELLANMQLETVVQAQPQEPGVVRGSVIVQNFFQPRAPTPSAASSSEPP